MILPKRQTSLANKTLAKIIYAIRTRFDKCELDSERQWLCGMIEGLNQYHYMKTGRFVLCNIPEWLIFSRTRKLYTRHGVKPAEELEENKYVYD